MHTLAAYEIYIVSDLLRIRTIRCINAHLHSFPCNMLSDEVREHSAYVSGTVYRFFNYGLSAGYRFPVGKRKPVSPPQKQD